MLYRRDENGPKNKYIAVICILVILAYVSCRAVLNSRFYLDWKTDQINQTIIGMAAMHNQDLSKLAMEVIEEDSSPNPAIVSHGILSALAAGKGGNAGGRCNMMEFDYTGRLGIWVSP